MNVRKLFITFGILVLVSPTASRADVEILPDPLNVDPTKPTLVDIDLKDVPVQQAFDAVCSFSKTPTYAEVWRPKGRKHISIKLDKTPFAEALVKVAREADLGLSRWNGYPEYETRDLPKATNNTDFAENWIYAPLSNDGAFCGLLQMVQLTQSLSYAGPLSRSRQLLINVATVPEPQIVIYSFEPFLTVKQATDENDLALKKEAPETPQQIRHPGENIHTAGFYLSDLPAAMGHELKSITTVRHLQIVTQFRRIEITEDDLLGGTSFTTDGVAVQLLQPVSKKDFGLEYKFVFRCAATVPKTPDAALVADGTMCAMMDDADQMMQTMWRSPEQQKGAVNLIYRFSSRKGKTHPARLILFLPLAGGDISPTFRFEHVPLGGDGKP